MTIACCGSQKIFLFSLWWILTVEVRFKVPSTKISSGISERTHYISSPNFKLDYSRESTSLLSRISKSKTKS
ncbi:Bgt-51077 [Blumeria graminis f. sp. tritici]|uniref:Bgt-51077 n=1 Tax=Blumeria graminis f. sp. tritici TaxID=62690 RepID=A0A9X9QDI0_BLUGR|nr:Bgt-51077 [Blumeria graminis f. sp. tritici]